MQPKDKVRKMRPARPGERDREDPQAWYQPGQAAHYVSVEVWPPNPAGVSYPMQLPEHHTALTPDPRAFEQMVRDGLPDGWFGCLTGHNRYRCVPAHPGEN